MKFSEKWLREWVDPAVDTDGLAEQLTLLGLEVDDLETRGGARPGRVRSLLRRVSRGKPQAAQLPDLIEIAYQSLASAARRGSRRTGGEPELWIQMPVGDFRASDFERYAEIEAAGRDFVETLRDKIMTFEGQ